MDNTSPTMMSWMDHKNVRAMLIMFLVIISIFFAVQTINELRAFDEPSMAQDLISVDGYGEVATIANTATVSFSVIEDAKTVAEAQQTAATESNAIIDYLKGEGIADKDISTDSYNINPKYDYAASPQICTQYGCPPSHQVITGYEVSQSMTVKIRDTSKAGDILVALGQKGASNVSNLSFGLDQADQEQFELQAKQAAIADAKSKAQVIAQSLGVRLGRVVGMDDSNVYPVYGAKSMAVGGADMAAPAVVPELPQGENKVTANVTISFEIK